MHTRATDPVGVSVAAVPEYRARGGHDRASLSPSGSVNCASKTSAAWLHSLSAGLFLWKGPGTTVSLPFLLLDTPALLASWPLSVCRGSSPASPLLSDPSASVFLLGTPCDYTGPCWVVQKNPHLEILGSITAKLDDLVTGRGSGCGRAGGRDSAFRRSCSLGTLCVSKRYFHLHHCRGDIKVIFLFFHAGFLFGS